MVAKMHIFTICEKSPEHYGIYCLAEGNDLAALYKLISTVIGLNDAVAAVISVDGHVDVRMMLVLSAEA